MAVALDEGGYALQQENSKKIFFQLKLTDSSLRALEGLGDDVAVSIFFLDVLLLIDCLVDGLVEWFCGLE